MLSLIYSLFSWLLLGSRLLPGSVENSDNVKIIVDPDVIVTYNRFWNSTGFCPPLPREDTSKWFLSNDMYQNLALISSVPHAGIKQVRIHYLLETIKYNGRDQYDLNELVQFLDRIINLGLQPGFEVMGNPQNTFTDFGDHDNLTEWYSLVSSVAMHLQTRYGKDEIQKWNFESWNEPDNPDHWDALKGITMQEYFNYWDVTLAALNDTNSNIIFGGPGENLMHSHKTSFGWNLLGHITNGTNYWTNTTENRIDFIASHNKGTTTVNDERVARTETILEAEKYIIGNISNQYPSLIDVPYFNDEGDPIVTWSRPYDFHNDIRYPAMIVKIIDRHFSEIIANPTYKDTNFGLISNDNGFLTYTPNHFSQRTLTARFQVNSTDNKAPLWTHLVPKSALTAMGFLSKLYDSKLNFEDFGQFNASEVGVILTTESNQPYKNFAGVLYNSADDDMDESKIVKVTLDMSKITNRMKEPVGIISILDNEFGNPYKTWKELGSPSNISDQDAILLWQATRPKVEKLVDLDNIDISLKQPSVTLVHICDRNEMNTNGKVSNITVVKVKVGVSLIVWSDQDINCKCIQKYQIYFLVNSTTTEIINDDVLAGNAFLHHHTFKNTKPEDYKISPIFFK